MDGDISGCASADSADRTEDDDMAHEAHVRVWFGPPQPRPMERQGKRRDSRVCGIVDGGWQGTLLLLISLRLSTPTSN
ncbi:hypothetical protein CPLU01_02628 [Colletotrichum plurivorum]|uniref:Uncharacterized protein n=1 Tax=Colletotrichum plurivorum TaxID=2175906 RepID=A0A8H6KV69_9PEZI|nr:hypothetical protein CPLU01_02628 [Colletotrichum plurivorum]